ncbi:hypothetical protein LX82_00074 [Celeribacter halophilus]|uniref:Uncharacterized protein n=1 Tax=Celeribacter halophilus TaxID=576117 RepID=A0A1I3MMZ6_9RHOB|nr:hypothetical protein LX82_00074 [Celeribacter halophilus]SFI98312.1 hypothetical protein SAMN04488138_10174 [Celeribacter halophilus]
MEASTGIEPVYTDLQSLTFINNNNILGVFWYQDICRTRGEPDTLVLWVLRGGCRRLESLLPHRSVHWEKKVAGRVAALSDDTQKFIALFGYQKSRYFASSGQEVWS